MHRLLPLLALCLAGQFLPAAQGAAPSYRAPAASSSAEGRYVVQQLDRLTRDNWARVAGRDTGLSPHRNGHDELAAAWTREVLANLHGLPAGVVRQSFPVPGFRYLPAKQLGVNVAVTVPGSRHPDEALVIGAHYDGEPFSRGSAYDDGSGSAVLLGLSRVLGAYWRAHGLPSLTVELVLFDAEEQGLIGSTWFALAYHRGAIMPHPALMINEEQSGVAYPVRPFGLRSRDPLPSFAATSGRVPYWLARQFGGGTPPSPEALALLTTRLKDARSSVFRQLRGAYGSLSFRGGRAGAFAGSDQGYLQVAPFSICCSDNDPFDAAGVPTATLSGDYTYYQRGAQPWAFPYDQPQDTLAALACDTGGSPRPGAALQAALTLPLEISRSLVLSYAPAAHGTGVAAFSTPAVAGHPTELQAVGARQVDWSFGDGGKATGASVRHTYAQPGRYRVILRSGGTTVSRDLEVASSSSDSGGPPPLRPPPVKPWHPAELQKIAGCH